MKRKQKLYLATFIFLAFSIAIMFFVLSDLNKNTNNSKTGYSPSINIYPQKDKQKIDKLDKNTNGQNDKLESANKPSGVEEEIDWRPIIEKWRGKEISKISADKKIVALTFDAGGNADGVDAILKTLGEENIKASFFLTGKFIEKFPDKTQKIIDYSKDLGNHSYSHPHLVNLNFSKEQTAEEIEKTEELISKFGVKFKPFFRFPFGERDSQHLKYINDKNYISIRWSIDSLGWKGISGGLSKESVKERVLKQTAPGAIVLMHLGSNPDDGANLDSEALSEIIQELKNQGYEFATLTELLVK